MPQSTFRDPLALPKQVREIIDAYDLECMEAQYTDSGEIERHLNHFSAVLRECNFGSGVEDTVSRINEFLQNCAEAEYTDTGEAWELLHDLRTAVAGYLEKEGVEVPERPQDPNLMDEDEAAGMAP